MQTIILNSIHLISSTIDLFISTAHISYITFFYISYPKARRYLQYKVFRLPRNINYVYKRNINRDDVQKWEIRYLPDLSIVNLVSVNVLVRRILNYHPNYTTHRLYFREVETPYLDNLFLMNNKIFPLYLG